MDLKILLPFSVFMEKTGVDRIVIETAAGSHGLLPRRLDCVAVLVPGILVFEAKGEGEAYVAVDEGILVKAGERVTVSVHNAVEGTDMSVLHDLVDRAFLNLDERERNIRRAMAKMESGFIRGFMEFHRER